MLQLNHKWGAHGGVIADPAGGRSLLRSLLHTECERAGAGEQPRSPGVAGRRQGRKRERALFYLRGNRAHVFKATASPGVAERRQGRSFVPCDRTRGLYWLHFSKRTFRPQWRQHLPSVPADHACWQYLPEPRNTTQAKPVNTKQNRIKT